jgi:hypothetical protein
VYLLRRNIRPVRKTGGSDKKKCVSVEQICESGEKKCVSGEKKCVSGEHAGMFVEKK